jgi:PAS domain S-box-containing protein
MNDQDKTKEERASELIIANKENALELVAANKEVASQNDEEGKHITTLIATNEENALALIVANKELVFQNEEKGKRAAELLIANKELAFQNREKEKRAAELIIANKELTFQNREKEKRAAELLIANKELVFQNEEKGKRAAELLIANKELAFQNREKEKRADELKRNKQLLDETEKLARVGGWEIDLKNNKLSWSDVVYQIHEIESDYQPTIESAINFYAPESIPVISEAVRQAIEEDKSYDIDLQLITAKQNRIWVRAIGQAYRVNGEIVKIGGVFQDINERKQAEEELRESEEKHRTILQTAMDGFWMVDIQGRLLEVNETYCRMSGYSAQELLTMCITDLEAAESSADTAVHIQKIKSQGEGRFETRHRRKDGSIFDIEASIQYQFVEDGRFVVFIQDISERKQAEEALLESEQRMNFHVNNSPLATIEWNTDFVVTRWSGEAEKIFGWNQSETIGKSIMDFPIIYDEDIPIVQKTMERLSDASSKHVVSANRNYTKSKKVIYCEWYNSVLLSPQGKMISVMSQVMDITERKQAEEALIKSEEKFRDMVEHINDVIFTTDANGIFTYLSPAVEILGGYKPEDMIGHFIGEFLDPLFVPKIIEQFQKVMTGILEPMEYRVKVKSGDYKWVRSSSKPILKENIPTGMRGVLTDITERKRTEEALFQSEENFRRSISESPLGIRIISVDGKTIYANKAFLDIFEFNSLEEFTSLLAINRYTPESYAQHKERKEKRNNGHEVFDYEVSIVRENAEIRHLKVSRKEVLWNGIKHYQLINFDITEQKKLTIDLIQAKEHAEESDRLKSAFLANVSHEIRTPMNGILGFAELLKEAELSGEQQQEYIRIIEKSGARMLNIINDIVSISKIESGTLETYISDTNINGQTEYVYNILKRDAEKKKLNLILKNGLPDKESIIQTDNEKFIGILSNLVKNAIKYTDQGSIEFGYNLKKNSTLDNLYDLEFYIKDTGIGIPKDRQEAIFGRFIQADIQDKMARQGAGLGLAISRAYVEMLGGKIWVESKEGIGSTFYFSIPYNTKTKEKPVKSNLSPDREDKVQLKILIVEDDETSEVLMKVMLHKLSKEVLTANNGLDAINLCHQNPDIDLILMDIQMPKMNGYKATQQIRQFNKEVIIIAQTAFGLEGDREKSIEAGCNDHISKPIRRDELTGLMQKYFKK